MALTSQSAVKVPGGTRSGSRPFSLMQSRKVSRLRSSIVSTAAGVVATFAWRAISPDLSSWNARKNQTSRPRAGFLISATD